jgi:hypothetical protein
MTTSWCDGVQAQLICRASSIAESAVTRENRSDHHCVPTTSSRADRFRDTVRERCETFLHLRTRAVRLRPMAQARALPLPSPYGLSRTLITSRPAIMWWAQGLSRHCGLGYGRLSGQHQNIGCLLSTTSDLQHRRSALRCESSICYTIKQVTGAHRVRA